MKNSWFNTNWNNIAPVIPHRWQRLTLLDLEVLQGNPDRILSKLQEKYNLSYTEAQRELEAFRVSLETRQ